MQDRPQLAISRAVARPRALKRERLSDQLMTGLLSDIVAGRYPPGAAFASEGELVERFSISRVVAREALRMLGSIHVVNAQQGRRASVLPVSDWDLFSPHVARAFLEVEPPRDLKVQLYDTRSVVEGGAAALCARACAADQLADIQEQARRLTEVAAARPNLRRFLECDRAFHEAVARGSGNAPLRALLRSLGTLTAAQWNPGGVRLQRQALPIAAAQHQQVAEAIA
ncbi:MAG: FadR/GntR family transcriptional regulator, partial [Candidatus Dormibacteraceae bacterium]